MYPSWVTRELSVGLWCWCVGEYTLADVAHTRHFFQQFTFADHVVIQATVTNGRLLSRDVSVRRQFLMFKHLPVLVFALVFIYITADSVRSEYPVFFSIHSIKITLWGGSNMRSEVVYRFSFSRHMLISTTSWRTYHPRPASNRALVLSTWTPSCGGSKQPNHSLHRRIWH